MHIYTHDGDNDCSSSHVILQNLYGRGQSFRLPTSDYRFLTPIEIKCLNIERQCEDQPTGYIFEVRK